MASQPVADSEVVYGGRPDETTDVQHAEKNLAQLARLEHHDATSRGTTQVRSVGRPFGLRHQARRPAQRRARVRKRGRIRHAAQIRRWGRDVALRRGAHEDRPGQSRRP